MAQTIQPSHSANRHVGHQRLFLLNGKNTGQFGVVNTEIRDGNLVRVTTVERTLIDAVVRPQYAGGIETVLEAYRNARDAVSISRLAQTIRKLEYIYPYHQAVGFLLERSGAYTAKELQPFVKMPIEFDFYLDYEIDELSYDHRWRLFYSADLD